MLEALDQAHAADERAGVEPSRLGALLMGQQQCHHQDLLDIQSFLTSPTASSPSASNKVPGCSSAWCSLRSKLRRLSYASIWLADHVAGVRNMAGTNLFCLVLYIQHLEQGQHSDAQ